jgi:hypothetical protein
VPEFVDPKPEITPTPYWEELEGGSEGEGEVEIQNKPYFEIIEGEQEGEGEVEV